MSEVFLKIDADKLTLANLKDNQMPMPVFNQNEITGIIFYTENEYCDYLKEIEKASTKYLSEYWLSKTPQLIEKNRYIIKVLTILQDARAKKYISI